jgi:chromosome segregation ATPase
MYILSLLLKSITMELTVTELITSAFGLLGLGSGGFLAIKSTIAKNRLAKAEADAEAKKIQIASELEEVESYKTRIRSLGDDVSMLENKVSELRAKLIESEEQRTALITLSDEQEVTIDKLKRRISLLQEKNEELERANQELQSQLAGQPKGK